MVSLPQVGVQAVILGMAAFNANAATVQQQMNAMGRSAYLLERTSGNSFDNTGSGFNGMINIIKAGAVVAAGAIATIGAAATMVAADYEKKMAFVGAVSEATSGQMKELDNTVKELGRNSTVSIGDLVVASGELVKAGLPIEKVFGKDGAAKSINDLMVAAGGELSGENAALLLAVGMNAFSKSGAMATQVADAATAAVQRSALSFTDYAHAMKAGAGIASQFGMTINEFSAVIGTMGRTIKSGTEVGTAFKNMLMKLQNPAKEDTALMDEFGVSLYDADKKARPFRDVLIDLTNTFDDNAIAAGKMDEATRARVLGELFEQRAIRAVIALMNEGVEGYDAMLAATERLTAADLAAKMLLPTSEQLKILLNNVNILATVFGEGLLPVVGLAITSMVGFAQSIPLDKVYEFGTAIATFLLNTLGNLWNVISSTIIPALNLLRASLANAFSVLTQDSTFMATISAITAGIQTLFEAIIRLTTFGIIELAQGIYALTANMQIWLPTAAQALAHLIGIGQILGGQLVQAIFTGVAGFQAFGAAMASNEQVMLVLQAAAITLGTAIIAAMVQSAAVSVTAWARMSAAAVASSALQTRAWLTARTAGLAAVVAQISSIGALIISYTALGVRATAAGVVVAAAWAARMVPPVVSSVAIMLANIASILAAHVAMSAASVAALVRAAAAWTITMLPALVSASGVAVITIGAVALAMASMAVTFLASAIASAGSWSLTMVPSVLSSAAFIMAAMSGVALGSIRMANTMMLALATAAKNMMVNMATLGRAMIAMAMTAARSGAVMALVFVRTIAGAVIAGVGAALAAVAPLLLGLAAIGGAAALLATAWSQNWGGIQGVVGRAVAWIIEKLNGFLDALSQLPLIGEHIGGARAGISGFLGGIPTFAASAGNAVQGFVSMAIGGFQALNVEIPETVDYMADLQSQLALLEAQADATTVANEQLSESLPEGPFMPSTVGVPPGGGGAGGGAGPSSGGGAGGGGGGAGGADEATAKLERFQEDSEKSMREFGQKIDKLSQDTMASISKLTFDAEKQMVEAAEESSKQIDEAMTSAQERIEDAVNSLADRRIVQARKDELEEVIDVEKRASEELSEANDLSWQRRLEVEQRAWDDTIEIAQRSFDEAIEVRERAFKEEQDVISRQRQWEMEDLDKHLREMADKRENALKEQHNAEMDKLRDRLDKEARARSDAQRVNEAKQKADIDLSEAKTEFNTDIAGGMLAEEAQAKLSKREDEIKARLEQDLKELEARRKIAEEDRAFQEKQQSEIDALRAKQEAEQRKMRDQHAEEESERKRERVLEDLEFEKQQEVEAREFRAGLDAEERAEKKRLEETERLRKERIDAEDRAREKTKKEAERLADLEYDRRRRELETQLEDEELEKQKENINAERDERVKAIEDAMAEKQKKIQDQLAQELADLSVQLAEKVSTIESEFNDKMADLVRDAGLEMQPAVDEMTGHIIERLVDIRTEAEETMAALAAVYGVEDRVREYTARHSTTPDRHYGGVVPGPWGASKMVRAHGGETFEGLGSYGQAMTAVRAAERMRIAANQSSGGNTYHWEVNASYGRTQPEGSVRQDISAIVALARR